MTDRELLELAAEAAAIDHINVHPDGMVYAHDDICTNPYHWNPLTDDGDALRLAVKLNLDVDICFSGVGVCYVFNNSAGEEDADNVMEPVGDDPCAATRRAIVRAAAAIGEKQ